MGTELGISALERTRRFWRAHGRSVTHVTVLHAFCTNPSIAWSPEGLSLWYGLRLDRVRRVVEEFARCGILRRARPRDDMFVWNGAQDWAVPRDPEARAIVQERWAEGTAVADRG